MVHGSISIEFTILLCRSKESWHLRISGISIDGRYDSIEIAICKVGWMSYALVDASGAYQRASCWSLWCQSCATQKISKRLALTNDEEELKLVLEHGRKPDCCLQLQGRFGWSVIAVLQDSQLTGRIPRAASRWECDFTRVTGNQFAKA